MLLLSRKREFKAKFISHQLLHNFSALKRNLLLPESDPIQILSDPADMLTCIACSKQLGSGGSLPYPEDDDAGVDTPSTLQAIKSLTSQIKDMAVKASEAYRHCKPCSGSAPAALRRHNQSSFADSDSAVLGSDPIQCGYRRAGESSGAGSTQGLLASGDGTPASMSGRTEAELAVTLADAEERKEWVAQVDPGVLLTFVSVPEGGNDLKRIRFSREMFNKWQAQKWWAENYDKVMELYNVKGLERQPGPLAAPSRSEDESSKMESAENSPVTPPLSKETKMTGYSSVRTSSEVDRSGELSVSAVSNTSEQETEWVEHDQPGVYITIRALPGGIRELRRVRFSRERFGEMHAREWWEENRARIHEQYL